MKFVLLRLSVSRRRGHYVFRREMIRGIRERFMLIYSTYSIKARNLVIIKQFVFCAQSTRLSKQG